jgi:type IV pilus assembly protein PilM
MINWKLKTRSQRPIGLDIGYDSIKMIQLAINGGHISVLAADKVRVDPRINGDAEERRRFIVSAVKQMMAGGSFVGKNVVSYLPNDRLRITSLRLAETEGEGIDQALRKEAVQRFGLDPEEDVINYVLAGDVRQEDEIKNELILFAADDESIRGHIELLEEAGLRPVGIDALPCALFRSFERSLRRQEDKERTVVFVDVGSRFTTVVFGRGGEMSFVKQISIGEENFNREIAAKLGVGIDEAEMLRHKLRMEKTADAGEGPWMPSQSPVDPDSLVAPKDGEEQLAALDASTRQVIVDAVNAVAEELAREIALCFRYYTVTFRGKRVGQAVFSGEGAYEEILLNVLKRQLAVEIEVAQPLRGLDMMNVEFDGCKRGLLCEWVIAVGLSLKGWNKAASEADSYERN